MSQDYFNIYDSLYRQYVVNYLSSYYRTGRRNLLQRIFDTNDKVYEYEKYLLKYLFYAISQFDRRPIDSYANGLIRLRPDAKYFLLVNFHTLIIQPLLFQENSQYLKSKKDLAALEEAIAYDIKMIINISASGAKNLAENESTLDLQDHPSFKDSGSNKFEDIYISGHSIMSTIDRIWRDLKTTKFEIWG